MNLPARITARLVIQPGGCVVWTGTTTREGYGRVRIGDRMVMVHRLAYEVWVGPIPEGYEVDHLCFVPACAAPWHLEAVTQAENQRRASDRYRAENPACRRCGAADWSIRTDGRRDCRPCHARRDRRRAATPPGLGPRETVGYSLSIKPEPPGLTERQST